MRSFLIPSLAAVVLSACTAATVSTAPGASKVVIGDQPPPEGYEQLGAITAKHGYGCGLYGSEGNFEGAYAVLRNKAAALGADYVHVLRVVLPGRMEGLCLAREFVIDGIAYKGRRP
jgi:hypothetical protein